MESKTDLAILGMLTVEPMSGYDMKQFCEQSLAHFWHESFGNLYPRLKRLANNGLIKGNRVPSERGPDAILYSLTTRGRTRLQTWLLEPPEAEHVRSEFMLKFFFGAHAPADVIDQMLLEYEQQQTRIRQHYKIIEETLRSADDEREESFFWLLSLRRGQLLTAARLRWCRECRTKFANHKNKEPLND